MLDLQIRRQVRWFWIYLAALAGFLSIVFEIWLGPTMAFWSSSVGLLLTGVGLFLRLRKPDQYPRPVYSVISLCFHTVLIAVAFALQSLFLTPLSENVLRLPSFTTPHVDPAGLFDVLGPSGWNTSLVTSPIQTGVRYQPGGRDHYMGASDIQILVQALENPPKSKEVFLRKMAVSLAQQGRSQKSEKEFDLKIETANLLRSGQGVWSILDVKRFWVPLRQVSLFGIKDDRYLCSVSVTGLKSHSTLYRVLCLALFEKLRIKPS